MRHHHAVIPVLLLLLLLRGAPVFAEPLHVVEAGKEHANAAPLVLVHGWACDASFWDAQLGPLSEKRRVLAVELPGHGKTPAEAAPCELQTMSEAVAATLDNAGVERAYIAGHSMGAAVARWFAHLHPQRAVGLIIVDGALMPYPDTAEAKAAWQQHVVGMYEQMASQDDTFSAGFIDSMHGRDTPPELAAHVREKMLATPREVRLECMRNFVEPEVWNLPPVLVPTLAVYVENKNLPPNNEELLRAMFPNLEYRLWKGAGHFLHMERPGELNSLMEGFMEKVDAGGA